MTDEELVAQELARLDTLADDLSDGNIDDALYAYVRAWAIRQVPVNVAAAVLRHETLRALRGGYPWVSTKWPVAVFHLQQGARLAGVRLRIPGAAEARTYVRSHPCAPGRVFPGADHVTGR